MAARAASLAFVPLTTFLGLRVLTYWVMGNDFQILIEVPKPVLWLHCFDDPTGEEPLMQHLGEFYGKGYIANLRSELVLLHSSNGTALDTASAGQEWVWSRNLLASQRYSPKHGWGSPRPSARRALGCTR